MPKFKVNKVYRDKFTRIIHGPGEILELTQERANEINKAVKGAMEKYEEEAAVEEVEKGKKPITKAQG